MLDLTGPLDAHALAQGRILLSEIPALEGGESIARIFDHWSVENYIACDGSYNVVIGLHGGQWIAQIATSPRLNAVQVGEGAPYAAHTYHRNSHAVGIAVNGMVAATTENFGAQPVQLHEIEVLCAANAAVALKYHIDLAGGFGAEHNLLTHAECAVLDGYAWDRWDLARLRPSYEPITVAEARATGDLIRARSREYKLAMS